MPSQLNVVKLLFVYLLISIQHFAAKAQKIEQFSLIRPEYKVANSLYKTINFIDSRNDTSTLGIVQTGAFNRQALVVAKDGLGNQIKNVLADLTDSTAANGELLLQLRLYNLAEVTSSFSEKGYFKLYAHLFAKVDNGYSIINSVDTLVVMSAMDVTNALLKAGSNVLTDFIANNLTNKPQSKASFPYSYIVNIDRAEKKQLRLYTADTFTDGVYYRYRSFKDQIPDGEVVVEGDSISDGNIKVYDAKRKLKNLNPANAYAVVFKGKPYITNTFGYHPVYRRDDDVFFNGRISIYRNASAGTVIAMSALFGIAGGLIASSGTNDLYDGEVKIDYLTGEFIVPKQ
ncbi:hypothetical protein [Mucilaginibacter auburnensis]|uniref:Uncharacterized protein n=1 Tax=Mucilaginibacter auburnensis TaxID=1457233 RepID=A0A2H9VNE9_9SPHI|nr:hypothetical protein [Mucilaginibacter auburnensis]PJJ79855.1 hypothetical protein CLV57_2994 [Mucilaginibacter auburnensis]